MQRKRVRILVEMDLDPVPGAYNTPEDCAERVQAHLKRITPHYHPTATFVEVIEPHEGGVVQFAANVNLLG